MQFQRDLSAADCEERLIYLVGVLREFDKKVRTGIVGKHPISRYAVDLCATDDRDRDAICVGIRKYSNVLLGGTAVSAGIDSEALCGCAGPKLVSDLDITYLRVIQALSAC